MNNNPTTTTPPEETKSRIKEYKNLGKDPEECRRRRQEVTVQLRKVNKKFY